MEVDRRGYRNERIPRDQYHPYDVPPMHDGPRPTERSVIERLPEENIDREKTCPLLLRVFYKIGGHHRAEEFDRRGREPQEEVQIYTWRNATFREITDLLKQVMPETRNQNTKLSFALVYPEKFGTMKMRGVGLVISGTKGEDDFKTLASSKFETGDFLDVAIYPN